MKILHFADVHIGVENYGRVNPATGLNTRLEDFLRALDILVETALSEAVDLVLFAGDAFKVNEPTNTHQRVFAERIRRLSDAQIPVFLLIGNHDQTNRYGDSHALDIYATLQVPGVYVSDRPQLTRLDLRSGPLQIVSLPHVSKSALMAIEGMSRLDFATVDRTLIEQVDDILAYFAQELDPHIPAILAAHVGVEQAKLGSEHTMSIGYGFTLPLGVLARPEYQYVALGHIHKHQVLCQDPPVIYPGSLERVDFGEEKEDKGFIILELAPDQPAQWRFVTVPSRRFITLDIDLQNKEQPTAYLLDKITAARVADAIVRVTYTLEAPRVEEVDSRALRKALEPAFHATIRPILQAFNERIRMPDLNETEAPRDPLQTLESYLTRRNDLAEHKDALMERAKGLWQQVSGQPTD